MKLALISDIHSNAPALKAVLADIDSHSIDRFVILGDQFGYYPWAVEVWEMLKPLLAQSICIRGNHDLWVAAKEDENVSALYYQVARGNALALHRYAPEALEWLRSLSSHASFEDGIRKISLVHGTPADPVNGRLYPNFTEEKEWFPKRNEMLFFGHTHYPVVWRSPDGGLLVNPGSVGQPRDGDPRPAWALVDTESAEVRFFRIDYDLKGTVGMLESMNWTPSFIASLKKTHSGSQT